jgi:hypothetical protein
MESSTTVHSANVARAATPNGMTGPQPSRSSEEEARRQALQRAEEMADRLGEQVGHYVAALGHSVLKWVARAREEAEDIWAEAQALRERQQAGAGHSKTAS